MEANNWFDELVDGYKDDPAFITEKLVLEINEEICRLMHEQGLNRSDLANRLGVKRQFITKILNGNPNLTLLTLVKIAVALGAKLNIQFLSKATEAKASVKPSQNILEFSSQASKAMSATEYKDSWTHVILAELKPIREDRPRVIADAA